jgi:hydrogenase maturation protease
MVTAVHRPTTVVGRRGLASRLARGAGGRSPIGVDVLICGSIDRGDDGAPIVASRLLRNGVDHGVRLRLVGQLDIDHLLAVRRDAGVVIVDAVTGLRAGTVVELPLNGLIDRDDDVRPRSSHALEFREVIGLADMIRGHPLPGRIVAVGGRRFTPGAALTPRVARAIPHVVDAVVDAVSRLRE